MSNSEIETAEAYMHGLFATVIYAGATIAARHLPDAEQDFYITNCDICHVMWVEQTKPIRSVVIRGLDHLLTPEPAGHDLIVHAFPVMDEAAARVLLQRYGNPNWPDQWQGVKFH